MALLVDNCDQSQGSDYEYSLFFRGMVGKKSEPLSEDEEQELISELAMLIADGYRMRSLAHSINSILDRK